MAVTAPPNAFIGRTELRPTPSSSRRLARQAGLGWSDCGPGGTTRRVGSGVEVLLHESRLALRLLRGKRTILWLSPCQGCFRAAFVLGDKALLAARHSRLSALAMRAFQQAERYPEGTGVRLLVKGPKDIPTVKKLAVAKLEN